MPGENPDSYTLALVVYNALHAHAHIGSDIRDLISIDDVMEDEDLKLGPNGGLVFCLE